MLRVSRTLRLIVSGLLLIMAMVTANSASAASITYAFNFGVMQTTDLIVPRNAQHGAVSSRLEQACLATAIYHEARGEAVVGQFAVAATILNRVRSRAYPDTVCGVVFQNAHRKHACQFSFACDDHADGIGSRTAYDLSTRIAAATSGLAVEPGEVLLEAQSARAALSSLGAFTHYHRYDIEPAWSQKLRKLVQIGNHVFYESKRVTKRYAPNATEGYFSHLKPYPQAPWQLAAY